MTLLTSSLGYYRGLLVFCVALYLCSRPEFMKIDRFIPMHSPYLGKHLVSPATVAESSLLNSVLCLQCTYTVKQLFPVKHAVF